LGFSLFSREETGNSGLNVRYRADEAPNLLANSTPNSAIPYAKEQGIAGGEQGMKRRQQGFPSDKQEKVMS